MPELADLSFTEEMKLQDAEANSNKNVNPQGIMKADRFSSKDIRSSRDLMNDMISSMRDQTVV
eukprot:CAMPEP_0116884054 /NCGR_PEP_ID=MMETSP0463-20121206/16769_1 /TAXON_ID=181622 /ORGANISM="Strombidinopsis sp, Strain SopsisLIS2011" /LENGTH=62 /DNA_ID=CAMNT_0004539821 /DNA_START=1039 /DNA_END=1227 /DNA_ORIENTATION=-